MMSDSDMEDVNYRRLDPEARRLAKSFASVRSSGQTLRKVPEGVPGLVSQLKSEARNPIDTKQHKTQLKKLFNSLVEARQEEITGIEETLSDVLNELEKYRKDEEDKLARTVSDLTRRFQHQIVILQEQYAKQVELLEAQTTDQLARARHKCEVSVEDRTKALMQELRASGKTGGQVAAALRGRIGGFGVGFGGSAGSVLGGLNGGARIRRPISMVDYRDPLGKPVVPAPVPAFRSVAMDPASGRGRLRGGATQNHSRSGGSPIDNGSSNSFTSDSDDDNDDDVASHAAGRALPRRTSAPPRQQQAARGRQPPLPSPPRRREHGNHHARRGASGSSKFIVDDEDDDAEIGTGIQESVGDNYDHGSSRSGRHRGSFSEAGSERLARDSRFVRRCFIESNDGDDDDEDDE